LSAKPAVGKESAITASGTRSSSIVVIGTVNVNADESTKETGSTASQLIAKTREIAEPDGGITRCL